MPNQCTCFHLCHPITLIRVTGDDAASFLQGQFTNDLQQEGVTAVYGLWLNQKGRVLADSNILRIAAKEFLLTSATSSVETIRMRLEDYIIADDVTLSDESASHTGICLWGAGSDDRVKVLFGATPVAGGFLREDDCFVYRRRGPKPESYEIVGPMGKVAGLWGRLRELGCLEASAAEAEWARIVDGIPSVPQDIGPGDLPNEAGLEQTAISYTKGCYLGQEVMARLKNMGQVRRRLHIVRGSGEKPQAAEALWQDGRKVGEVRSVASRGGDFVALAMLSLLNLKMEGGLSREANQPATLRIIPYE